MLADTLKYGSIQSADDLARTNNHLEHATARERIAWARETFGPGLVLSTSFGSYSAVMLNLVKEVAPDIKVMFIDTGFLTPETYRFKQALSRSLGLDVRTFIPARTRAEQEALEGPVEIRVTNDEGLKLFSEEVKVEPFERGLASLGATAWMSGVMRGENSFRGGFAVAMRRQDGLVKVHPILEWTGRDCREYIQSHGLPVNENYYDVCKVGSRECGIHLTGIELSRDSSDL